MGKLFAPKFMRGHDILIKYVEKEEYADQLKYGGLYMRTPKYYKEQGYKNFSIGDPNELDDVYPVWCASIFHNPYDIKYGWKLTGDCKYIIKLEMSEEASQDIIRALVGYKLDSGECFESLGNYAVVFFNASQYVGNIIEGFTDANIYYSDRYERAIPIECGKVFYGKKNENHPKLYKVDERFSYQREYRIRLGIKVDRDNYDRELNLKEHGVIDHVMDGIKVYDKEDLLNDYRINGFISFQYTYDDISELFSC